MKSFYRNLKSAVTIPPSWTGLLLSYSAWRNAPGCPRWQIVPVLGFHSIIPLCAFVLRPRKSYLIFLLIFSIFSPPLTETLRPLSTSRSFGQMTLMTLSLSECVCKCHFRCGKSSVGADGLNANTINSVPPSIFLPSYCRCLIKDFELRPNVLDLLQHVFIKQTVGRDKIVQKQLIELIDLNQQMGVIEKTRYCVQLCISPIPLKCVIN